MIIKGEMFVSNIEQAYDNIKKAVHKFMGREADYDIIWFSVTDCTNYIEDVSLMDHEPIPVPGTSEYQVEWKAKV